MVLGETYQYGPHFKNIRRLRREQATGRLLLDVGVDENLWTAARGEGYVSFPPLLDGGLQSFLYDLMLGADRFAIPLPGRERDIPGRADRAAPRLPAYLSRRQALRGRRQGPVRRAQRRVGLRQAELLRRRDRGALPSRRQVHLLRLDIPGGSTCRTPSTASAGSPSSSPTAARLRGDCPRARSSRPHLLAALEQSDDGDVRVCHALEFAGAREPEQTVLRRCIEHLSREETQSEFWLLGDDEEGASVRTSTPSTGTTPRSASTASIRPRAKPPRWTTACCAGTRPRSCSCTATSGRSRPRTGTSGRRWRSPALWRWSPTKTARPSSLPPAGPRCARAGARPCCRRHHASRGRAGRRRAAGPPLGAGRAAEPGRGLGRPARRSCPSIRSPTNPSRPTSASIPRPARMREDVQAIDVFFDWDPEDPTGERAVSLFVAFIQSLVPYRIDEASRPLPASPWRPARRFSMPRMPAAARSGARCAAWRWRSPRRPGSTSASWILGAARRPEDACVARAARPARARACGARGPDLGAAGAERSGAVPACAG